MRKLATAREEPGKGLKETLQMPILGQEQWLFFSFEIMKVKIAQSRLSLSDPMDYTVYGILQARILGWVAFPFSRGSYQPRIEPRCPTLQVDSLPAEP